MPISVDQAKPVIQIDERGQQVAINSEQKAPKQVDVEGRPVEAFVEAQTTAPDPIPATPGQEQAAPPPKNPEAEARKLFLQAQKAERKAKEAEKKAQSGLKKAEAIEAAIKLTNDGGDPTAVLKAAGIDPIKWYKDMTTYALSDKGKPEDPVQKELREHKERLDQYAKNLEVQTKTVQEREEVAAHNNVIATSVIPLIEKNPDRYETLLTEYGANAAVEVYKKVWDHYQATGETVPFEQAADALENFWATQVENGINSASKMKKFANRFAQSNSNQRNQAEQTETPNRSSFTLSNKQTAVSQPSNAPRQKSMTAEERYQMILKKHGVI